MEIIVFLDRGSLRADLRTPGFPHEWRDYDQTLPQQVVERLRDATIAIVNKVRMHADVLAQLPRLRMIAVAATGTDNVDLEYCRTRGITVSNVRGYASRTVPEHVMMLALALRRSLPAYREDLRKGEWQRATHFALLTHEMRDLHGSTLGIVGHGTLGRAVERLARAFGMDVLVSEHKGAEGVREGRVSFVEALSRSDVLTLHAPLTEETRGLIGKRELETMKPSALLINTARGGLVDEEALVEALKAGVIAGAGVDVLGTEPPRGANPLLDANLPNLVVTPHVAWASREAMQALADQLLDNVEAFVRGRPQNVVNG